ncbi:hypothetical protein D7U74_16710 [Stenotrophomonas maltophilia]|uniref:hypothetical protein n=1 Tax=Stenotrophomonas maltophilia TaxID=40324 RepID=UPI0015DE0586|nr:hypothetical protein [Stenotrophomonas maltophilia]MBA0223190.1 hypothetical protein [Stenotrophomonas maltophilia]
MEEMEVVNPPCRIVPFRGERLEVKPLRLEQLGPFISACRATIGRIAMIAGLPEDSSAVDVGALVLDLLEQNNSEIAAALAVAVDQEPQWISAGSLEEVAQLLEAVAGLNKDFFARRLRRMVAAIREAVSLPESPTSSSS